MDMQYNTRKVIQVERTLNPGDEGSTVADKPCSVTFVF